MIYSTDIFSTARGVGVCKNDARRDIARPSVIAQPPTIAETEPLAPTQHPLWTSEIRSRD